MTIDDGRTIEHRGTRFRTVGKGQLHCQTCKEVVSDYVTHADEHVAEVADVAVVDPTAGSGRVLTRSEAIDHMTMWWDETLWLPFVESEDCDITGPGHQDKAAFAALVNAYDAHANSQPAVTLERVDAAMVVHDWIRVLVNDIDEWVRSERVPQDHPDAVAVTTIWGVR